jgi:hypothetical protein
LRYYVWRRIVSPWLDDGVDEMLRVSIIHQIIFYILNFSTEIFLFVTNDLALLTRL